MSKLGSNRALYTKRQWAETQRILTEWGFVRKAELKGFNILTYVREAGKNETAPQFLQDTTSISAAPDDSVVVQLYSTYAQKPDNGSLAFFPSGRVIGMWDFVKQENIRASAPGIPRFITRIVETVLNA